MAVLASDDFTGANGSAWGSTWTGGGTGAGGVVDVQSNAGRMTSGTAGGYASGAWTARRLNITSPADVEITGTFTPDANEPYGQVFARATLSGANVTDGYALRLDKSGTLRVEVIVASSGSNVASISRTHSASSTYGFRLRIVGTTIQARTWTGTEPGTWDINTTDSTITAAGVAGLATGPGNTAVQHVITWDAILVTDGAAGTPISMSESGAFTDTVLVQATDNVLTIPAEAGAFSEGMFTDRPASIAESGAFTDTIEAGPRLFTALKVSLQMNGTWVDVTSRVHTSPVTIRHGRATEFDDVGPSVLTLVLTNADGALMPDNPGSPYWPYIVEDVPILVQLELGPSQWYRYGGWVKAWEPDFPSTSVFGGVVKVTAVDALGVTAGVRLPSVWVAAAEYLAGLVPTRWDAFVLEGDGGAAEYFDNPTSSGGSKARATMVAASGGEGSLTFGSAEGLSIEGSANFSPASTGAGSVIKVHTDNPIRCLQFWVRFPAESQVSAGNPVDVCEFRNADNTVSYGSLKLTDNAGTTDLGWFNAAGAFVTQVSFGVTEDRWARVTLTTVTATPTTTHMDYSGGWSATVSLDLRNVVHVWFGGMGGDVAKMSVAGITMAGHESAAIPAYLGIPSSIDLSLQNRLNWWALSNATSINPTVGTDTADTVMVGTWHERTALEVGQEIARTGQGVLWTRPGEFSPRYYASDVCYPATPLITIDCDGDLKGAPKLRRAVDSRPTRAVVTYPAGKATVIDEPAEAANQGQARSVSSSTLVTTYADAETIGTAILARGATGLRITSITLDLESSVTGHIKALFDTTTTASGLRPTARLRLLVPVSHFGVPYKDVFVQGWTETYDPVAGCSITFDLSPAS